MFSLILPVPNRDYGTPLLLSLLRTAIVYGGVSQVWVLSCLFGHPGFRVLGFVG